MKFTKKLKIAFGMLKNAKIRSWLTIIGIVIAVASVSMILSFGQGINKEVQNKLGNSGLGIYTLYEEFSWEGGEFKGNLMITHTDYEFLKEVPYIEDISRTVSINSEFEHYSEDYEIRVSGVDLESFERFNEIEIIEGKILKFNDIGVIIISTKYINDTFKNTFKPKIGDYIELGSKQFLLVGIFKSTDVLGFSLTSGYISFQDAKQLKLEESELEENYNVYDKFGNLKTDTYDSISVKFNSKYTTKNAKAKLTNELIDFRDSDKENKNFYLEGKEDALGFINKIVDIVKWVLVGFASISIVVGCVGVANTMYTAVIEKTKEIGIMKAIGAKDSDIEHIFLLNSGMLGLAGGIIGVLIGMFFAITAGILIIYISKIKGISLWSLISFQVIFGSLIFSILIGMISGYFPAKSAAAQDPVVALRGE